MRPLRPPETEEEREAARAAAEPYHRWYYEAGIWGYTTFLGVNCYKSIVDLWNYQEIIVERRPSLVVELGTYNGGSALYFSSIQQAVAPGGLVLTVDRARERVDARVLAHPHVEVLTRSTTDPSVAHRIAELRETFPGPIFAILDSDHHKRHVLAEMRLLRGVLVAGDYLVVEDGNINGHPVLPGWGEGPSEAIAAYAEEFPDDYERDTAREWKFGFTFAPGGFLIRR